MQRPSAIAGSSRASALDRVRREVAQLGSEKSALDELGLQLGTDETSLLACIEIVRDEGARSSEQLAATSGHLADVDQQIAAAVEEDLATAAELDDARRRLRAVHEEVSSLEAEVGQYRGEIARARGLVDTTFQHTLRMGYRLRHESGQAETGHWEDEA